MTEYDNSGSGWVQRDATGRPRTSVTGEATFCGQKFYLAFVPITGRGDNPVMGKLYLDGEDGMTHFMAAVWASKSDNANCLYSGTISITGHEYWVNVFRNNKTSDQAPDLGFTFREKEPKPEATPKPPEQLEQLHLGDDIPF